MQLLLVLTQYPRTDPLMRAQELVSLPEGHLVMLLALTEKYHDIAYCAAASIGAKKDDWTVSGNGEFSEWYLVKSQYPRIRQLTC